MAFVVREVGLCLMGLPVLLVGGSPLAMDVFGGDSLAFSKDWQGNLSSARIGCHQRDITRYTWREAGFGSNINLWAEAWAAGIIRGHIDLAVVLDNDRVLGSVKCLSQSDGVARVGWPCIFRAMPHVCSFDNEEEWKYFMELRDVSKQEQEEAIRTSTVGYTRMQRPVLHGALSEIGMSLIGALAVYLKNASDFLRNSPRGLSAADITGLWVASDDATVLPEMLTLAPRYFPNIGLESIIWVSGRTAIRSHVSREPLATRSVDMKYDVFVTLMADLQMLREADVFVGTFSSNIGRLMVLLREASQWPRNTTRSVHVGVWFPGRKTRL